MVTSQDIRIRISTEQKKQLLNLAQAHGHKTLSSYIRTKIFDGDLALHSKVNKIIQLLEGSKNE